MILAAPEHQEINGQVEVTWRTLRTVAYSLMVHSRFLEEYVNFALMYTTDHIFPVLPIKYLINEDGDTKTPHKLSTGAKPSVSNLRVLFCPCVVPKATAHVDTKKLNMRHQSQKGFRGIFVSIPEHKKGYLVYIPSTKKIISSYDFVFEVAMRPEVTYTLYGRSSREQTGGIIKFAQFEEENILTKTCNDAESGDESDNE